MDIQIDLIQEEHGRKYLRDKVGMCRASTT